MTTSTDHKQESQESKHLMTTNIDLKQETSNDYQVSQKSDPSTANQKTSKVADRNNTWISEDQLTEEEINELIELHKRSPWLALNEVRELANLQVQFPWLTDNEASEVASGQSLPNWISMSEIDTRLTDMDEDETHRFAELMAGMDVSANHFP